MRTWRWAPQNRWLCPCKLSKCITSPNKVRDLWHRWKCTKATWVSQTSSFQAKNETSRFISFQSKTVSPWLQRPPENSVTATRNQKTCHTFWALPIASRDLPTGSKRGSLALECGMGEWWLPSYFIIPPRVVVRVYCLSVDIIETIHRPSQEPKLEVPTIYIRPIF